MTDPQLGPESLLGIADGEDSQTLHDRLDLALRYLANWYKATDDSQNRNLWWARIDQVREKVETAERAINPGNIFPSVHEVNLYNDAALVFPGLWRDLTLSADTLPQPSLLDIAADFLTTAAQTPSYLITAAANAAGKAAGDSAKQFFLQAWPLLAAVGVGAIVYFFRAPILRALQTGAP